MRASQAISGAEELRACHSGILGTVASSWKSCPRLPAPPASPSHCGSMPSPALGKDTCCLKDNSSNHRGWDLRRAQLSKAGICEKIRAPPSGWFPCQELFPHPSEVNQHQQEPLAQLIKERESACMCTQGHTRWNTSSQARRRKGDEADPGVKDKERVL